MNVPLPDPNHALGRVVQDVMILAFRQVDRINLAFNKGGNDLIYRGVGALISQEHRLAFVLVPKVATRTFMHAFLKNPAHNLVMRHTRGLVNQLFGSNAPYRDYHITTFVRNPWARVVSCYFDKIYRCDRPSKLNIISRYEHLQPGMSFDNFIRWLCSEEGSDDCADHHWRSQHRFITGDGDELYCEFIGKLENLQSDWLELCRMANLPYIELPHRHPGAYQLDRDKLKNRELDYRSYFTDETKRLVARRYQKDCELFDYEF